MKVRLVSRADIQGWILGKFALKMQEHLRSLDVDVDIADEPDSSADINHYMIYLTYDTSKSTAIDTVMITHIDMLSKLEQIKHKLEFAKLGICMSEATMKMLDDYGIRNDRLAYVNPAHDSVIKRKKIYIGITTNLYLDGRKREQFLVKLIEFISPDDFSFKIMGEGWEEIIATLRNNHFEVEHYAVFDYTTYIQLVPSFDYYLYMGQDEGSMGFIDALSAGVKTIVTPQGYHLDVAGGITHSFDTFNDLKKVFENIAAERTKLVDSVKDWTWKSYAVKHFELWSYLLNNKTIVSSYKDGLNSLTLKTHKKTGISQKLNVKFQIIRLTVSRFLNSKDKVGKIRRKLKI